MTTTTHVYDIEAHGALCGVRLGHDDGTVLVIVDPDTVDCPDCLRLLLDRIVDEQLVGDLIRAIQTIRRKAHTEGTEQ